MSMEPQQPPFIPENSGHPDVVAYRLGQVEMGMREMTQKLGMIAENYPNTATINLLLQPMRDDIQELKQQKEKEAEQKSNLSSQLKLGIAVAIMSPLFSLVITILVTGELNK